MLRCLARAAALVTFLAATTARADDAPPSPPLSPALSPPSAAPAATPPSAAPRWSGRAVAAPELPTATRRSPTAAVLLSLGVTAGSVALAFVQDKNGDNPLMVPAAIGFLAGPSVGHWYSGKVGTSATLVRGASALVTLASVIKAVDCTFSDDIGGEDHEDDALCDLSGVGVLGGALAYSAAGLIEIGTAAHSATEYNRRHGFDLRVTPTAMRGAEGTVPGLALGGRF